MPADREARGGLPPSAAADARPRCEWPKAMVGPPSERAIRQRQRFRIGLDEGSRPWSSPPRPRRARPAPTREAISPLINIHQPSPAVCRAAGPATQGGNATSRQCRRQGRAAANGRARPFGVGSPRVTSVSFQARLQADRHQVVHEGS